MLEKFIDHVLLFDHFDLDSQRRLHSKETLKIAIYVFWHAIRNYRPIRVDHDAALDTILYVSARGDFKDQERKGFENQMFLIRFLLFYWYYPPSLFLFTKIVVIMETLAVSGTILDSACEQQNPPGMLDSKYSF